LEKVIRGPGYPVPYFAELGIAWPHIVGPLVSQFELIGAVCLLLGLATRVVGVLFACEMLVALAVVGLPVAERADSVVDAFEAVRLETLLTLAATSLALLGAGRCSGTAPHKTGYVYLSS
jgi:putative oxidoreductase